MFSYSEELCSDFDRWMEKLGITAANGVKVVCRQELYRSNYALIDGSFNPYPVRHIYCLLTFPFRRKINILKDLKIIKITERKRSMKISA